MTQANPANGVHQAGQPEEWQVLGEELATTIKNLLHESNVRRITIKHAGQTALEIPLTAGIVGTLLVPWLAAVGAMGALLAHFTIEVERTDTPVTTPVNQHPKGKENDA